MRKYRTKKKLDVAEIIKECEPFNRNIKHSLRRVTTRWNHHLIKARSVKEVFEKCSKTGE